VSGDLGMVLKVAVVAGLASAGLSALARRYALSRLLLDIPNERSLHTSPTPRGGGIAIVAVVLAGVLFLALDGRVEPRLAVALEGGGALVAAVGWLDDRRSLSARVRLVAHTIAAVWLVAWLGGMPWLGAGTAVVHQIGRAHV